MKFIVTLLLVALVITGTSYPQDALAKSCSLSVVVAGDRCEFRLAGSPDNVLLGWPCTDGASAILVDLVVYSNCRRASGNIYAGVLDPDTGSALTWLGTSRPVKLRRGESVPVTIRLRGIWLANTAPREVPILITTTEARPPVNMNDYAHFVTWSAPITLPPPPPPPPLLTTTTTLPEFVEF